VFAVAQPELFDAPMAALTVLTMDDANRLLAAWGHKLGPIHRPFTMEAYALELDGRPIAVAVSASTVSSHIAGWWKLATKEEPVRYTRQEVVELARCAASPTAPWANRVMLRLWREVCAPRWRDWPVIAAVSYSHNGLHTGQLYRFDGWTKVNDRCGSNGGGTYSRPRYATDAVQGRKSLWIWRYA
jgi:hypothetical protein